MKLLINKALNSLGIHIVKKSTLDNLMQLQAYASHYMPSQKYVEFVQVETNVTQDFHLNNPLQPKDKEDILICLSKMDLVPDNNSLFFMRKSSTYFLEELIQEFTPTIESKFLFSEQANSHTKKYNNIFIFEPNIAATFILRPHYLEALRAICKNEIFLFFYATNESSNHTAIHHKLPHDPLFENYKIYLEESYVRQKLHEAGFLEAHGLYLPFHDEYLNTSRKVDGAGYYQYIHAPHTPSPKYKGLAAIRAHRRSFRDN